MGSGNGTGLEWDLGMRLQTGMGSGNETGLE